MKKLVVATMGVLSLIAGSLVCAEMDFKAKAADYADKIKVQDAVIAEHKQMKATPGLAKDDPMQIHCAAAIRDAEKLKKDYEWFQKYYEAKEAEGK